MKQPFTFTTLSPASPEVDVRFYEAMATLTLPFHASQLIDMCGYSFEVVGINTGTVTAEMVELVTAWNVAASQLVAKDMGIYGFAFHAKLAITRLQDTSCPNPARCSIPQWPVLIDFVPESLHRGDYTI